MMVSEEASTVQEDVTSTEASTKPENQEKVNSGETKSGRPSAPVSYTHLTLPTLAIV